jgi:hypothetical protein
MAKVEAGRVRIVRKDAGEVFCQRREKMSGNRRNVSSIAW